MQTIFQPLPDGEPPHDVKQFLHRLRNEPGFAEKMQSHYETMLATPHSPETADMHRAAAAALRTLKHHQGAWKAMNALQEATQLANPAAGRITDETLRRIRVLTDGASDDLLDTLEPERTRLMTQITLIRGIVQAFGES